MEAINQEINIKAPGQENVMYLLNGHRQILRVKGLGFIALLQPVIRDGKKQPHGGRVKPRLKRGFVMV